jgi:hypothetical protein
MVGTTTLLRSSTGDMITPCPITFGEKHYGLEASRFRRSSRVLSAMRP